MRTTEQYFAIATLPRGFVSERSRYFNRNGDRFRHFSLGHLRVLTARVELTVGPRFRGRLSSECESRISQATLLHLLKDCGWSAAATKSGYLTQVLLKPDLNALVDCHRDRRT